MNLHISDANALENTYSAYSAYHTKLIMCGTGVWGHRCYYLDHVIGTAPSLWGALGQLVPWGSVGLSDGDGQLITLALLGIATAKIASQLLDDYAAHRRGGVPHLSDAVKVGGPSETE
jgi:hypothetical protein